MSSPIQESEFCKICGTRIGSTTSGDLDCLSCLLRVGLEEEPRGDGTQIQTPDTLGAYVIARRPDGTLHQLGSGAMGVTFLAEDVSLQRPVALKIINAAFARKGADARERFMREARAAASLRHPNVATVYQFGIDEDTGEYFYAMELIEGETLEERVHRTGPLDFATVLAIAHQVSGALAAAEKRGLVHRDLKPGNIMIATPKGGDITVKVIDFGVAKALQTTADTRHLTLDGFVGTPAFASPEQRDGQPVDVRSDIYSLGATLWFLLAGVMPSPGQSARLKAAHVPARFRSLLLAMLAPEPAARPSVQELTSKLETWQRSSRRPLFLAVAALITGAIAAGFYFFPAPRERDAASFRKSIAVLPFDNLSDEKGSSNFADGVQDELLTDLARISDLKVVSRTSALQYRRGEPRSLREIGHQLGVAFVVEGTVRAVGHQVRVSVQLIDARTDLHRWAQQYDRPLDDVFAIQSEIAESIAQQLDAKISPRERAAIARPPTSDLVAFDLYTQARSLLVKTSFSPRGKDNLFAAAKLLEEAVARDPKFLAAWCQLAEAHDVLYFLGFDHTPARLSLGEAAANTAHALQPASGEAHLARARHLYQGYLAYEPALAELALARRAMPNDSEVFALAGYIYRRLGKWDESIRQFENALSIDPRNFYILQQVSISYSLLRRYADAAAALDRAIAIVPRDVDSLVSRAMVDLNWRAETRPLHALIAAVLAKKPAAAPELAGVWIFLALCERDHAAAARAVAALGDGTFGPGAVQFRRAFWEGLAARVRGDTAAAEQAFLRARAEQEHVVAAQADFAPALCTLGVIDAALGRKAEAICEGRRAVELLPVSRDPINGVHMLEFLAGIYAWSGEPELACDELEVAQKFPSGLSYGQLRLSPLWDDLRGQPRFDRIVAALTPSGAK